jgi:hypothetical protein
MKKLYLSISVVILANVAALAQTDIHSVDFKNFAYQPSCADMESGKNPETITVKDGEFSRDKDKDGNEDHFFFTVTDVNYGDLTGDKQDEAVVLSVCNTGGTGQFSEGFIYSMKAGKPVLLARVPGGDRADGGLRSLTVENGLLVVDANDPSPDSGACCPEFALRSTFRLTGDKLSEVGKAVRRELYPKKRLSFAKGTSETTFTVKIAVDDRKRYIVGARAGQTLSVSANTGGVYLGLLGDTETKEGTNSFTAVLPNSGDYTIEVGNDGDKEIEVTITIKIL